MRRQHGMFFDLHMADLAHLTRLNDHWFRLDEPLDVAYHLGLPIDGYYVNGCLTNFQRFVDEMFSHLLYDANKETVRRYTRAYIMMLLSTQLFGDKSGTRMHIRWLPYVARLEDMGRYSWRSAALSWLYRCLCCVVTLLLPECHASGCVTLILRSIRTTSIYLIKYEHLQNSRLDKQFF
ncbi:hypothetical protein Ahy_A03g015725 [Arachis hypogaea]|uniref:Aminotransferase-like plant mobile domain-containing protein n=1 Tax=Arachis hypogaea TaxID=3818 RepID=A0A445E1C5_ARAHY|nr:hypothetical protein Ahy_A03g015725 [Arachis hypogaea]